jgi:hypothetical protein
MTTKAKGIFAGVIVLLAAVRSIPAQTAPDLSGLWVAKLRFEPSVPMPVTVSKKDSGTPPL